MPGRFNGAPAMPPKPTSKIPRMKTIAKVNVVNHATLKDAGFKHDPHVILGSTVHAHEPLPGVRRIAALIKSWFARARCGDCGHDYFVPLSC
jgi:hypothetical protein